MATAIHLLPHQEKAIAELKPGSILCGGVGTGKSLTALAYYYIYICTGVVWSNTGEGTLGPMLDPRPLYIITTARKRDTHEWEKELERFDLNESEVEITIDSWNNIAKYQNVFGTFFIFDEQRLVGKGKWVKAFYKIARKNKWILLSATPGDTWLDYVPVFVANGFYKNRTEFLQRHAVYNPYITKFPKIDRWTEVGVLEKHRRDITVRMEFMKATTPHWETIKDDSYDREAYKRIVKDRWNPWEDKPIENISQCCYLMRKASSTGKVSVSADHKVREINARALEIFHMCCQKHPKLIVFYNYDYELEDMKESFRILQDELQLYSGMKRFPVAEWNGHKHEKIPTGERWIYLVQYTAGAEGWNCVETDTIIFYSRNYSYKLMTQAAGRIDRLNTRFTDLYYYAFATDAPIDKAIEKAIKNKKDFNEKRFWNEEVTRVC